MTLVSAPTYYVLVTFSGTTETNITADVVRSSITRGRGRERESMSPGRAQIELWNYAGKYDPDNTSGTYYPNIRPGKLVRILTSLDSGSSPFTIGSSTMGGGDALGGGTVDVALFTGRLEGGPLTFEQGGLQPRVSWTAVDAGKRLNRDRSIEGFETGVQPSGSRVEEVLSTATPTWPTTEMDIDPGVLVLQETVPDAGRWDYLQAVAESEGGAFYIGANGYAIFRDSGYEPAPASIAIGSSSGEYDYSSITIVDDEQEIFNEVTVTANALTTQTASDLDSQGEFGRSDLTLSTMLNSTGDMAELATARLAAYSQPRRRISQLRVDRIAEDWYFFLSKELMDRVTVRHRPVYGGTFEQVSVIHGINIDIDGSQDWAVTWNLGPPVTGHANLLTTNQSGIETDATGWVSEANCSLSQATDVHYTGQASLQVNVTAVPASLKSTPVSTAPVTVGTSYTASGWISPGFGSVVGNVEISWRDGGGAELSTTAGSAVSVFYGQPWQKMTATGTAPGSATHAVVRVEITEIRGLDICYLDSVSLKEA